MNDVEPNKMTETTMVRTWKVRTSARGVEITINGVCFELGSSAHAFVFDVQRAALGLNAPEKAHIVDMDR